MLSRILLAATALSFLACASTTSNETVQPYPFDTCVVMDHAKLGSMGDPITRVVDGQEIKFCCAPCVEEFEKDPETYLARLKR